MNLREKNMQRRRLILLILLIFAVTAVSTFAVYPALGQDATIPTRTPTPDPNQPTATAPPPATPTRDNGDGGGSSPNPTSPPPTTAPGTPGPTATAVVDTSGTGTPEAGIPANTTPGTATAVPTADFCGEPPTFQSSGVLDVYAGPGDDYPVVGTLGLREVRLIVGRAEFATWWQIQLDAETRGWVNDRSGRVSGFTANVPLVAPPALDGSTPTPGPLWEPTAAAVCTPTPTATATATTTPEPSATPEPDATATTAAIGADSEDQPATAVPGSEEPVPTAEPLETSSSSTPNFLPIIGVVLIVAAVFVALFLRRGATSA